MERINILLTVSAIIVLFKQSFASRYKTYVNNNKQILWNEAKDICKKEFGTDLATITDDASRDEAYAELNKLEKWTIVWIGLRQASAADKWQWVDGTSCDYVSTGDCRNDPRWTQGQPDETPGCAIIYQAISAKTYIKVPCDNIIGGIKPVVLCNGPPEGKVCPNEKRYTFEDNKCIYNGKESTCTYQNADFGLSWNRWTENMLCTAEDQNAVRNKISEGLKQYMCKALNIWNIKVEVEFGKTYKGDSATVSYRANLMYDQFLEGEKMNDASTAVPQIFSEAFGCKTTSQRTVWMIMMDSVSIKCLLMMAFLLVLYNIGCFYYIFYGGAKVQNLEKV